MTSDKEPLLTRAKIREEREKERFAGKLREKELAKEYEREAKKIKAVFSKEQKKLKPVKKSRVDEVSKSRNLSNFLVKAIVIVAILLAILFYAVFRL